MGSRAGGYDAQERYDLAPQNVQAYQNIAYTTRKMYEDNVRRLTKMVPRDENAGDCPIDPSCTSSMLGTNTSTVMNARLELDLAMKDFEDVEDENREQLDAASADLRDRWHRDAALLRSVL